MFLSELIVKEYLHKEYDIPYEDMETEYKSNEARVIVDIIVHVKTNKITAAEGERLEKELPGKAKIVIED